MRKTELRKEYLSRQRALSPESRAAESRRIAERLFGYLNLNAIDTLHCFIPIERFNEINTMPIFERIWAEYPQLQTVVPRVEADAMRSLKFARETELVQNAWEIREPSHHDFVDPADVDVVLVPLLCADIQGNRVGYGKGFYDRFLRECRADCRKIGLGYFAPVERIDDVHEGDTRLDALVTPERTISFDE